MSTVSEGNLVFPYKFCDLPVDADVLRADESENSHAWWGVFTRPNREVELARKLHATQISVFLPMAPSNRLGGSGSQWLPLFPGYLFMFGGQSDQLSALASGCVSRILPVGNQQQLRNELLDLQRVLNSDLPLQLEPESSCLHGDVHEISDGKLAGLSGLAYPSGPETRLIVGIEFLGQAVSISLDVLSLKYFAG